MDLVEKVNSLKKKYDKVTFKSFLNFNRDNNYSYYIKENSKSGHENRLFNKLKKVKTMLNYDNDFVYDFLINNYNKDFGIVNPEMYSLGLRKIYYQKESLDYSSNLTDILESNMDDEYNDNPEFTRKVNPANRLINSFSYVILNLFTENDEFLNEAKNNLSKSNKYYFENDKFYSDFILRYSMKGLASFKLQYSNSLIDLSYAGYHLLDKEEKKKIKYIIKDSKQYKRYLKREL